MSLCPTCGTSLAYASARWPGETHFAAATLTDPALYAPQFSVHCAEAQTWAPALTGLPAYPTTSDEKAVKALLAHAGKFLLQFREFTLDIIEIITAIAAILRGRA